jgi:hypothetical protein
MTFKNLLEKCMIDFPQDDLIFKVTRANIFTITGVDCTTNPEIFGTFLPLLFKNGFTQASLYIPYPNSIVFGCWTNVVSITGKTDATNYILVALE